MFGFQQELFVDREKARQEFSNILSSKTTPRYLEFNAVAGQGKSELLRWIYHSAESHDYVAAYIDFERACFHQPDMYPILDTIATQLVNQIDPHLFDRFREQLSAYLADMRASYPQTVSKHAPLPSLPNAPQEEVLCAAFHQELHAVLAWRTFVICLDSTEKAYLPGLHTFEASILLPLTANPRVILVTAGQEKVAWEQEDVRKKIQLYPLPHFEPKWSHKQLETLAQAKRIPFDEPDTVAERMRQVTSGHPFSNYKLLDFLSDGFTLPVTPSVLNARFASGIQRLIDTVLNERILERTTLNGNYPPAKDILWYLAPLRHIDLSMVKYVLTTYLPSWFTGKPFTCFERLIGQFEQTYIFTRWQLGSGYQINPVVRNLLLWDMRENAPECFINMTETLEKAYHERVRKTHEATQIHYMRERLFHYATFLNITQPNYARSLIHSELEDYVDLYVISDCTDDEFAAHEQLNRLYSALKYDEELQVILDMPTLLDMLRERMEDTVD